MCGPRDEKDEMAMGLWKRGAIVGLCIGCLLCVALGIGIGWCLFHHAIPSASLDIQNQTMVQGNEEEVRQLQNTITNLTAEVQRYKGQLEECDRNLNRSNDQLQIKTEAISQCEQEREKCQQRLQACNHVGTLHKKHPWWLMVSIFSAMLLYI